MQRNITRKDVLRQLGADLIGKDSYRGVTLTYTWLANQFGHFSLGFVPTILIHIFLYNKSLTYTALWPPIIISLFWLGFETYNFLGPLLKKKHSISGYMYI